MSQDVAIKVENVSKTFKLPHEKVSSIKSAVINFYRRKRTYEKQKVLNDISFEIKKGEFFGVVGRNGSGKSTLLKLLAGIYSPDSGNIHINGKLTPFIELGVGFSPELTGRENVFLNGSLLGFSRKEMEKIYDEIVEFAELERFMDQKLKNYSSGMQVRLAFSIAIRAKSDIIVLDEVLAVGDEAFQQKCREYFHDIKKRDTTVVLVTHDMNSIKEHCDRALILSTGQILEEGLPNNIALAYMQQNYSLVSQTAESDNTENDQKDTNELTNIRIDKQKVEPGSIVEVRADYTNPNKNNIHFGLQIFSDNGTYCYGTNTKISNLEFTKSANSKLSIRLKANLAPGKYSINLAIMDEKAERILDYKTNVLKLEVTGNSISEGPVYLETKWDY
jgi:ABC-2 type transport system ATP-binding protein